MGKELQKIRSDNEYNVKIGFCLELDFRQNLIADNIRNLINFLEDNQKFIDSDVLYSFRDGLDDLSGFFYHFTDILFYNVDPDCNYKNYHKNLLD